MANPRLNSLDEYEQLKRKNRRRLVGASAMVVLAGILLAKVLNQGAGEEAAPAASAPEMVAASVEAPQIMVNNEAASADDASDLAPSAVLEPAPEADTDTDAHTGTSTELANPLAGRAAPSATETSAPEVRPSETAKPIETAKPATSKPLEATKPAEAAPPPVVVIDNQAERKAAAEREAAAKARQQAEQKAREQAAAKEAERKQRAERAAAQKAEAQKAEALKKQQAAKTQAEKKTSAQDALNNKAAKSAANPQAILEGSTTGGRVIIQAGAYSSSAQANQVLQKLADAGVSAHVSESETSKGTVYRVRTGSYPNRTAANQALAKIRQQGLDGMVIGQ